MFEAAQMFSVALNPLYHIIKARTNLAYANEPLRHKLAQHDQGDSELWCDPVHSIFAHL